MSKRTVKLEAEREHHRTLRERARSVEVLRDNEDRYQVVVLDKKNRIIGGVRGCCSYLYASEKAYLYAMNITWPVVEGLV